MNTDAKEQLPGAWAALVIAVLSIPLVLLRHLVALGLVMAVVALVITLVVPWSASRRKLPTDPRSLLRMLLARRIALAGLALSVTVWTLWRTAVLPF